MARSERVRIGTAPFSRGDLSPANSRRRGGGPTADPPRIANPQTLGNQALQRLLLEGAVQPKLGVGSPCDAHEQEADRVADQVMRERAPPVITQGRQTTGGIRRACGCQSERERVQRKPAPVGAHALSPRGECRVAAVTGTTGNPLPAATRSFFQHRMGHDFSDVRIHEGPQAAAAACAVEARAFTLGNHVVFGAGEYAPSTHEGQRLLAHELTHVIQQGRAPSEAATTVQRQDLDETESQTPEDLLEGLPPEELAEAGSIALANALLNVAAPESAHLRQIYNQGATRIAAERARMIAEGLPEGEIARRVSGMRHELALNVRRTGSALMRQGAELFDRVRGSPQRPTYETLRAAGKTDADIIRSATRTNAFINRLPRAFQWTGRGLWFVSGGISLYVIVNAPEDRQAEVAREEVGGLVGGAAGGALFHGLCILTGVATEGLALIACGVLGSVVGFELGRNESTWQTLDIAPRNVPDLAGRIYRVQGDYDVTDPVLFSIVHRRVSAGENVLVVATGLQSGQLVGGRGHYRNLQVTPANAAAVTLFGGTESRWLPQFILHPATPGDLRRSAD